MKSQGRSILFVSLQEAPWGGSEWLWAETALRLAGQGWRVAFVTPWRKQHPTVEALRQAGAREYCERTPRRWYRRWARRLGGEKTFPLRVLEAEQPVLTLVSQGRQDEGIDWARCCVERKLPYAILNQYTTEHLHLSEELGEHMASVFARARACWFVSINNARLLSTQLGIPLPGVRRVANPYRVPFDAACEHALTAPLSLAFVGRLDPETKGQDLMFEVLSQAKWRERELSLHLFGQGSADKRLRRLAARLDLHQVHFEGFADNPEAVWRAHQVVCQPSRGEGTPISMVEGMLMGRPVLGTRVAGIPELVEDNETGFLAEAPTVKHLDEAMERLWAQRARLPEMGLKAQQAARAFAGADPVGQFTRELLEAFELTQRD